jgi:long-chain acyl-CoA synthetase
MLVNEFLERTAAKTPAKEALIFQDRRLTYLEIDNFANSFGNALLELGLQKLDSPAERLLRRQKQRPRVAIYLDNSIESVISIFGILKAGGIFVLINPQTKAKKLEYILNDCQVNFLITDSKLAANYQDSFTDLKVISIANNVATYSFWELIDRASSQRPINTCIDIDLCSLIYTSGSTGKPKGVMLTHLNIVAAANSIIEYLENTSDDIILNCLPLSFDYGLYNVLMPFKFGGTVVLEKSFVYPFQLIGLANKERVTGLPLLPTIISIFLQVKNLEKYDFSRIRYITSTGQAFPPNHLVRLNQLFPQTKIYSMYGLTECKRVLYLPPAEILTKSTSVGKAMPNIEVYLVDEHDERISQPDTAGELIVRGSNVMQGYWDLPAETAKVLQTNSQGDKILRTRDLFKTDADGYFYFVARTDDLIKTGGERVSPKEIEDILCELAGVNEVAVYGVEHEFLGQAIKAAIVISAGSELTESDILAYCSVHLEKHAIPKYVEILPELPRTLTGKINRQQLESLGRSQESGVRSINSPRFG